VLTALAAWLARSLSGPAPGIVAVSALAAGLLFFPPGRHRHRELYRGTRWSVKLALFFIFGMLGGQVAVGVLMAVQGRAAGPGLSPAGLAGALMCTVAASATAVWILRLKGEPWWAIGLHGHELGPNLALGAQAGALLFASNAVVLKTYQTLDLWQLPGMSILPFMFELEEAGPGLAAVVAGAGLVPLCEEVLFRGVLFSALRKRSGPVAAVILSSVLFGVCHFPDLGMPTLIGLLLAVLYHRTGSLWTAVAAHSVVNLAAMGLAWNHGHVLGRLSWAAIGGLLAGIALLVLVRVGLAPARASAGAPGGPGGFACACGATRPGDAADRCPECAYPCAAWPRWITLSLRGAAVIVLVAAAAACAAVDRLAGLAYDGSRPEHLLTLQLTVLSGTGRRDAADALARRWMEDRRQDPRPVLFLAHSAYYRERYSQGAALLEALLKRSIPPGIVAEAKNALSLTLAEIGRERAEEAVRLGKEALASCPPEAASSVEDTLGWALLRAGHTEEARRYLDRELNVYGPVTRVGVAELAFHRGVLLWAAGRKAQARTVLAAAVRMGAAGEPFSGRSRAILAAGRLPRGLVPEGGRRPPASPSGPSGPVPDRARARTPEGR
jgi:membrane protease YdiL (CAAX protease family)